MRKYQQLIFCLLLAMSRGNLILAQEQKPIDSAVITSVLQEVVVSASRIAEKQLHAPVSVSKLTTSAINNAASPSFFDAIGNLKGVQTIVPGLGFKVLNTRGFSNTTNVRFVQLIDNIDNQSPHIGAPIANVLSPGNLDIDHVEVVQGAASALYGMNAMNGLVNITTKDVFSSQGFSIQQHVGINRVSSDVGLSPKVYNETAIRYARALSQKVALKTNLAFTKGFDWVANNNDDLNPAANITTGLTGPGNPAYDGVNSYGNESSNRRTLSLGGKNYVVARTGFPEQEVTDYRIQNIKGDVSMYYKPGTHSIINYTWRAALLNNVYQRSNRFRLQDYFLQQHILQLKSPHVQANAYINSENTGNSYNLRSMAENIDNASKTNEVWYNQYTQVFNQSLGAGNSIPAAHAAARKVADADRLSPGSTGFANKLAELQQVNNWDVGAALKVRAHLAHADVTVDLGKMLHTGFKLQAGADFRNYIIIPDGNYFINPVKANRNLNYFSSGYFVHASKQLVDNRLQLSAALRASNYAYFKTKLNPRITAVYNIEKNSVVRFSYQDSYRFPSIFEGFSNINSGGVKRVGGLKIMSQGIFENSWLKSSIDAFQAAVVRDVNTQGLSQVAAIDKNKRLLQQNTYTYLKPEQMHSFELGYRTSLLNNRLFIDADAYYNLYSNFIAQIEASVPATTDEAQVAAFLFDRNKQSRYRLWTNSKTVVRNFGTELDLRFVINKHYTIWANGCYQTLQRTNKNDGLEDGFNTPAFLANAGINGTDVVKNVGFNVTAKYQSSYYWQSFLVNGTVPKLFNLDAMVQYHFTKTKLQVKLGATNVLNRYYYSILGGPSIGGLYYTTLTYILK